MSGHVYEQTHMHAHLCRHVYIICECMCACSCMRTHAFGITEKDMNLKGNIVVGTWEKLEKREGGSCEETLNLRINFSKEKYLKTTTNQMQSGGS